LYVQREIGDKVVRLAGQFPGVVLTGARQVGKTTLLKKLFPAHSFVSLDLPSVAEQAEVDPELFFTRFPPPVVIDEVQYAPLLFRHLKVKIDTDRHAMGQFILTGSQKFPLMKEVADSLAGRAAILNLETLSSAELGLASDRNWPATLVRGFYPELWRERTIDADAFYSSYLASYLERDVRQLINVTSLRDFERFVRSCATRSGQLLNLSDLSRDVGIKPHTARDWLSVLEASNQITLLEPYFENVGKRIVKSPKLFFNDTGMLSFLLSLDEKAFATSPLVGPVWETFVFSEFRKRIAKTTSPSTLWFYRDAQGREVDFLLVSGGKLHLFECKWTDSPDHRWVDNLCEIQDVLRRSKSTLPGSLTLLCRTPATVLRKGVTCIHPAEYFASDLPVR
jgi:predicted AAA+ superfamily ATPase